jgi:hypothetical protein
MVGKPTTKRARKEAKEKRRKQWELLFAVLLVLLPEATHMPLIPGGLALYCCAWLIAMHLLASMDRFDEWTAGQKVVCVFILTLVAGEVGQPLLYEKWRREKSEAIEGDLFLKTSKADKTLVGLGESSAAFDVHTPSGVDLLAIFRDSGVAVDNDGGHLSLSTEVHDAQGKLVVKVIKNHWIVNPDKSICLDKNYTADSLEVKDGRGHVVLQVRLYPEELHLQGEWFDDTGRGFEIIGKSWNADAGMIKMPTPVSRQAMEELIPPVFEYPSSQHWAEWEPKRP